jgi:hypothetical protein
VSQVYKANDQVHLMPMVQAVCCSMCATSNCPAEVFCVRPPLTVSGEMCGGGLLLVMAVL